MFLHRSRHGGYFLPKVKLDGHNAMIYGRKYFDQLIRNDDMKIL